MESRREVKIEDIINVIREMGVSEEMLDNPAFFAQFSRCFGNSKEWNKPYEYELMEYDLESKRITLFKNSSLRKKGSGADISIASGGVINFSSYVTTSKADDYNHFNSIVNSYKLEYKPSDNPNHLPFSMIGNSESISIWKDSTTDEVFESKTDTKEDSFFNVNGIECKSEIIESSKKFQVDQNTLLRFKNDYPDYSFTFFERDKNDKGSNYKRVSSFRKFADVAGCVIEKRNGTLSETESFDNIIYWEQLERLWPFEPEDKKNRVIGPKSEEKLLEEIDEIKSSDPRIKEGLKKYVSGRDKYKSADYIKQEAQASAIVDNMASNPVEIAQSDNKKMGFTVPWVLGLVTGIVVTAIVILGIILIK